MPLDFDESFVKHSKPVMQAQIRVWKWDSSQQLCFWASYGPARVGTAPKPQEEFYTQSDI